MILKTEKFVRKVFHIEGVRVTDANMEEVAEWCKGEVRTEEHTNSAKGRTTIDRFIKVRVHRPLNERQTKAYVGDHILYAGTSFKVYTNKAFTSNFDPVDVEEPKGLVHNVFEEAIKAEELAAGDPGSDIEELLTTDEDAGTALLKEIFEQPAVNGIANDKATQEDKTQPKE